jgi:uncharacterized protein
MKLLKFEKQALSLALPSLFVLSEMSISLLYNYAMKIEELLRSRREQILEIARKHGAHDLRVFGSLARGEASEQSDIDFLVEVGPVHSAWFPAGLVADLEDLLGVPVDVVTRDGLHWFIKEEILQEARPL